MKVDVEKLRGAVARLAENRKDRRKSSDLMATVRPLLPVIEELRSPPPKAWALIAAALGEQGVTEKDGKPISERRLTSVYYKLKLQGEKRAARLRARSLRPDVPRATDPVDVASDRKRGRDLLAPELINPPRRDDKPAPISEEDILRSRRQKREHLYRKD